MPDLVPDLLKDISGLRIQVFNKDLHLDFLRVATISTLAFEE